MLTELFVLFVLLNQENTIYKIRKNVKKYFSLFNNSSLGAIHPALEKLLAAKCVTLKKKMSKGGQRSSFYTITAKGKKYFKQLMTQDLPENPASASQIVKIKSLLLPELDKETKLEAIASIKSYYKNKLLDFEEYLGNCDSLEFKGVNKDYIKRCMDELTGELNWLKFQELL